MTLSGGGRLWLRCMRCAFLAVGLALFGYGPAVADETNLESQLEEAVKSMSDVRRTRSGLDLARTKLEDLAKRTDNPDVALRAAYYLGRWHAFHAYEPDVDRAGHWFRIMRDVDPDSVLTQYGSLHAMVLMLYDGRDERFPAERLAEAETVSVMLKDEAVRREFHRLLGGAYLFLMSDTRSALRHYEATGVDAQPNGVADVNLLVSMAELNRKLGRKERALALYRKFLDITDRDFRVASIMRKASELTGEVESATP